MGSCAGFQGDTQGAFEYFNLGTQEFQSLRHPDSAVSYWGGNMMLQLGEYELRFGKNQKGYASIKEALKVAQDNHITSLQLNALGALGNAAFWIDNPEEAFQLLEEGLKQLEAAQQVTLTLCDIHVNISKYFRQEKADSLSLFHISKAIDLLEGMLYGKIPREAVYSDVDYQDKLALAYDQLGTLRSEQGKPQAAIKAYQQAIYFGEQADNKVFNRELARIYLHLAQIQFSQNQVSTSLENCHLALTKLIPEMRGRTVSSIPTEAELYPESVLLESFELLGKLFLKKYELDQSAIELKRALNCHRLAAMVSSQLRIRINQQGDKLLFASQNHKIAESALEVAFLSFQKDSSMKNWKEAFDFSEGAKANLLLEAASDQQAKVLVGIPDSTLSKEANLLQQQIDMELAIRSLKLDQQPLQDSIQKLESQLFKHRLKLESFQQGLREQFPAYFQMKYQEDSLNVFDIQASLLDEQTALVEYFVGERYVYAFFLSQQEHFLFRWEIAKELNAQVEALLSSITSFREAQKAQYDSLAYLLHQELIAPLPLAGVDKLIIIPDRELALLPFDALLTAPVQTQYNFETYPFLIQKYTISYGYSAQLLAFAANRVSNDQQKRKAFLGIAPGEFPGSPLNALPHTTQEVKRIRSLIGGELLTEKMASKVDFFQLADQFQILHFSTHARRWDSLDQSAWIALREADTTEYLYMAELAGLRLQNDLVILSACETGLGKIEPGEGVMSLARGFTYAGSQATLQSLWQIRPAAAEPLIDAFYEGLIEGKDKATALRDAKLSLLQGENSALQAPIMWAAFVPIGDMRPIGLEARPSYALFILAIGILLIGLLGYRIVRSRSK